MVRPLSPHRVRAEAEHGFEAEHLQWQEHLWRCSCMKTSLQAHLPGNFQNGHLCQQGQL